MRNWSLGFVVGALGLALAACSGDNTSESNETPPEAMASDGGAEEAATGDAAATPEPTASPSAAATEAPAAAAKGAPANDLTAYIGKFPFDEVRGVTWDSHPVVVAGIRATVTDAAVRRTITTLEGPSAPIGTYQGKVGSWACEQHNCGDHQWTVLVDPTSGATDVCYHNAAQAADSSRWFIAGGRQETRPGNCQVV